MTLLYGYAGLAVLAWWGGRESGGPTIAPVVIAYAVPVALILLAVRSRARLWQGRDELLDAQLYRADEASPTADPVLDDADDEDREDDQRRREHLVGGDEEPARPTAAPEQTAWRSDFSAGPGAADHLVDPERGER